MTRPTSDYAARVKAVTDATALVRGLHPPATGNANFYPRITHVVEQFDVLEMARFLLCEDDLTPAGPVAAQPLQQWEIDRLGGAA